MIKFNPITLDAEMVLGDTGTFSLAPKIEGKTFLEDGDHVWFTLRKKVGSSAILQKDVSQFENGIATIPILPSDTQNLDPGNYVYDLKLIRKDGNVDTLIPNKPSAYFSLKRGVK